MRLLVVHSIHKYGEILLRKCLGEVAQACDTHLLLGKPFSMLVLKSTTQVNVLLRLASPSKGIEIMARTTHTRGGSVDYNLALDM